MHNWQSHIGETVKDNQQNIIGTLESIEDEGQAIWGNINDEYEVLLNGAVYVIDLIHGDNHIRLV